MSRLNPIHVLQYSFFKIPVYFKVILSTTDMKTQNLPKDYTIVPVRSIPSAAMHVLNKDWYRMFAVTVF
jgi:hypothetical protein